LNFAVAPARAAFLSGVDQLVSDPRRLGGLLALEKRRRGVAGARLLFAGVSNVAGVRWCPMKAVLRSRAEEVMPTFLVTMSSVSCAACQRSRNVRRGRTRRPLVPAARLLGPQPRPVRC
jgi:hypothetical protein